MTIAMCYLSPEGIVLGADSTASGNYDPGGFHYFNHNQKLFEIGENSTLGALTWGRGSIGDSSHRTLLARLGDQLKANAPLSVKDVANQWAALAWAAYSQSFANEVVLFQALRARPPYVEPPAEAVPGALTAAEAKELHRLTADYYVGFCIAGYCEPDRTTMAYQIDFNLGLANVPVPTQLAGAPFWGAPNMILRLMNGWDYDLRTGLLGSGFWSGTTDQLDDVLKPNGLRIPLLPIRDAIDFV